jgi:hypothetical protein
MVKMGKREGRDKEEKGKRKGKDGGGRREVNGQKHINIKDNNDG